MIVHKNLQVQELKQTQGWIAEIRRIDGNALTFEGRTLPQFWTSPGHPTAEAAIQEALRAIDAGALS